MLLIVCKTHYSTWFHVLRGLSTRKMWNLWLTVVISNLYFFSQQLSSSIEERYIDKHEEKKMKVLKMFPFTRPTIHAFKWQTLLFGQFLFCKKWTTTVFKRAHNTGIKEGNNKKNHLSMNLCSLIYPKTGRNIFELHSFIQNLENQYSMQKTSSWHLSETFRSIAGQKPFRFFESKTPF